MTHILSSENNRHQKRHESRRIYTHFSTSTQHAQLSTAKTVIYDTNKQICYLNPKSGQAIHILSLTATATQYQLHLNLGQRALSCIKLRFGPLAKEFDQARQLQ
jgi:hypothetical protein